MKRKGLTQHGCEREKKMGRYSDGGGLLLQITETGSKSWIFRYERNGKERMMGLGTFSTFNLKEARERARAARQQLADGIDPLDARKTARTAATEKARVSITFKAAAEGYYRAHLPKWDNEKGNVGIYV